MISNALSRPRVRLKDQSGFTLIELLIVIVILGVLAGIVVFSVRGITDTGEQAACEAEVATVATAVEAHFAQNGTYATIPTLQTAGFLRAGTPEYVASTNATTGVMLMVAGAPCTAG
jgi:prepilin-type N-terminal cleavage/methylation domain-containing protein